MLENEGLLQLQDFYGPISEANILAFMAVFVNHPDANVRSKACNALGNMCRHTPHFYKEMVGVSNHNTCIFLFTLAVEFLLANIIVLVNIHWYHTWLFTAGQT